MSVLAPLFDRYLPETSAEVREKWDFFRNLVVEASEQQNLTTLLEPEPFFFGHVWDCSVAARVPGVQFPALDLGSGMGVPGLGMLIFGVGPWVLTESEGRKAEFLEHAARKLGFNEQAVRVFHGRAEAYLDQYPPVGTVASRAVGSLEKIYGWIGECSTWNSLLLFKGPGWIEESKLLGQNKWKKRLRVRQTVDYSVPHVSGEARTRSVVLLERLSTH